MNVDPPLGPTQSASAWKPLKAMIPYEFDAIRIECQGLCLLDKTEVRRFLALRILAADFRHGLKSLPPTIEYRQDNYNTERAAPVPAQAAAAPHAKHIALYPDPGTGTIDVTPTRQAAEGSPGGSTAPASKSLLTGIPDVARLPLAPPPSSERSTKPVLHVDLVEEASTAPGGSGTRAVAALSIVHADAASAGNLARVGQLFNRLRSEGTIAGWRPLVLPDVPYAEVDGLTSCKLPGYVDGERRPWAYVGRHRRRTCLLAELDVAGVAVIWLEIESRPPRRPGSKISGSRFALLACPKQHLEAVLEDAFREVVVAKGTWPEKVGQSLSPVSGVKWRLVRHKFEKDGKTITTGRAGDKLKEFANTP